MGLNIYVCKIIFRLIILELKTKFSIVLRYILHLVKPLGKTLVIISRNIQSGLKNFLEPAMFCHLAVLI